MRTSRFALSACLAGALASCGGGGGGGGPIGGGGGGGAPAPTPAPSGPCSLSARQDWVKARIDEWYLFPTLIAAGVNKANHSDVQSYIDALVAPARAQSRDRFFTYITSIAEENALINSGATAGFGFSLAYYNDGGTLKVLVRDSMEGAPALGQGIGRGDELVAVGALQVNTLPATSASVGLVIDALGPDTVGTSRVLRIQDLGGPLRDVTLAKTNFNIEPVSPIYGAQVFDRGGTKVGYINLRTFASNTAGNQLRTAFQTFQNQGVTQLIVDLRYNGGGLVSIAELFGDLMLANRVGQVFSYTTFRDSKASFNETDNIGSQPQAIAPVKIAFIGTGGSASASELLMNAMPPYLNTNVALIGENTYGKPVGQIAEDQPGCDDRLRVIAFKTENANRQGEYYAGLATTFPRTCYAFDDIQNPMGNPNENMISTALTWLESGTCVAIASAKTTQEVRRTSALQPERPNAVQQYIPGLF